MQFYFKALDEPTTLGVSNSLRACQLHSGFGQEYPKCQLSTPCMCGLSFVARARAIRVTLKLWSIWTHGPKGGGFPCDPFSTDRRQMRRRDLIPQGYTTTGTGYKLLLLQHWKKSWKGSFEALKGDIILGRLRKVQMDLVLNLLEWDQAKNQ